MAQPQVLLQRVLQELPVPVSWPVVPLRVRAVLSLQQPHCRVPPKPGSRQAVLVAHSMPRLVSP